MCADRGLGSCDAGRCCYGSSRGCRASQRSEHVGRTRARRASVDRRAERGVHRSVLGGHPAASEPADHCQTAVAMVVRARLSRLRCLFRRSEHVSRALRASRNGSFAHLPVSEQCRRPIGDRSSSKGCVPSSVQDAPRPLFVTVGRLHDEKLSADALAAFVRHAENGGAGSLVFVGAGPVARCAHEAAGEPGSRNE